MRWEKERGNDDHIIIALCVKYYVKQSLCDFAEDLGMQVHMHKKVFNWFPLPLKVKRSEIECELSICFTSQDYGCCPFQLLFPFNSHLTFLQFGCIRKNYWAGTVVMRAHFICHNFFCGSDAARTNFSILCSEVFYSIIEVFTTEQVMVSSEVMNLT